MVGDYCISSGLKIGRDHYHDFRNCQDNLIVYNKDEYVFGIISDGCGSCEKSEIASYITCKKILQNLLFYVDQEKEDAFYLKDDIEFIKLRCNLMESFFSNTSDDLGTISHDLCAFENSNSLLLATVIGFCLDTQLNKLLLFWCGDGFYSIDNQDEVLESKDNTPTYPIYNYMKKHNMDKKFILPDELVPENFQSKLITDFSKLTIASDGFMSRNDSVIALNKKDGIEIPDNISGLQYNKHGNFGLKKWMNVMWNKGFFSDDCAIITIERK